MTIDQLNVEVARRMSETALQDYIIGAAYQAGWELLYHPHDSRRDNPGYPDLTLVRRPRTLFIELKAQNGWFSFEQPLWLEELYRCGHEVYVWRPKHWLDTVPVRQGRRCRKVSVVDMVLSGRERPEVNEVERRALGGWHPELAIGRTKKPKFSSRQVQSGRRIR